jgi:hypothetical protein
LAIVGEIAAPVICSFRSPIADARRDLFEAMKQITDTGYGPKEHLPFMGAVRSNGIIENIFG